MLDRKDSPVIKRINGINGVRSFIVRTGGHGGNWIDRIDKVASTNVIDGLSYGGLR